MCTTLHGLSVFVYLAAWSAILYYMVHRDVYHVRHVIIPALILVGNSVAVWFNINSDCHMHLLNIGAATQAVLLFLVLFNTIEHHSARNVYSAGHSARNPSPPRPAGSDQ